MTKKYWIFICLKLCVIFVFAGRAYEHIFWDAPYRSLLWDQEFFSPVIEGLFNMSWNEYVTSLTMDSYIQNGIKTIGYFYMLCTLAALFVTKNSGRLLKTLIAIGGCLLIVLALLQTKSKFYHFSMFFEHAIQFCSPFVLLYYLKEPLISFKRLMLGLKIIIALTFISHGLYAIGSPYPLPANFVEMTINILGVSEDQAKTLLLVAGFLDFLAALLLFVPKTVRYALIYMVFWGGVTAMARIVNGLTYDVSWSIVHQYLFTTIYRIPHGLLPFSALLIYNWFYKTKVRAKFEQARD